MSCYSGTVVQYFGVDAYRISTVDQSYKLKLQKKKSKKFVNLNTVTVYFSRLVLGKKQEKPKKKKKETLAGKSTKKRKKSRQSERERKKSCALKSLFP